MQQLWQSLCHAFWRRPDAFDFWVLAFCGGAFLLGCTSWSGAIYSALKFLFIVRVWMVIFDYGLNRWPQHAERVIFLPLWFFGLFVFAKIAFSTDWHSVSQMRPDWQGIYFVLKMGAGVVCFFGPLLWLLDHVFKPFARRTGHHVLGAVGFIALCGIWWSGLVLGLLTINGNTWW